ncbi:MAG: SRPBCC family protein [Gemmatimonadaceae bacterium]|nr:SRPBCC family protein [Gemmatimonadaceae bacterium]
MATGTVTLHRVLRAPPERVYRAFLEPEALAKWLPPHGYCCSVQRLEAKVGGEYHASFTNFSTKQVQGFGGEYLELVPNARLVYTDVFDGTEMPGMIMTTVELKAVSVGTDLRIIQEGIPEAIPEEMCYLGWQDSLEQLMRLVEPNIPDTP